MTKFSFFPKPVTNVHPSDEISLKDAFDYIKSAAARENTLTLRELEGEEITKDFKSKNFDYVTFGGTFSQRGESHLISKSGLICLDIDEVENIVQGKEAILEIDNCKPAMVFISPSGNGLKAVYKYDVNFEHANAYKEIAEKS